MREKERGYELELMNEDLIGLGSQLKIKELSKSCVFPITHIRK